MHTTVTHRMAIDASGWHRIADSDDVAAPFAFKKFFPVIRKRHHGVDPGKSCPHGIGVGRIELLEFTSVAVKHRFLSEKRSYIQKCALTEKTYTGAHVHVHHLDFAVDEQSPYKL